MNAVHVALSEITATEADLRRMFDRRSKRARSAANRLYKAAGDLHDALADPDLPETLWGVFPPPEKDLHDFSERLRLWGKRIDAVRQPGQFHISTEGAEKTGRCQRGMVAPENVQAGYFQHQGQCVLPVERAVARDAGGRVYPSVLAISAIGEKIIFSWVIPIENNGISVGAQKTCCALQRICVLNRWLPLLTTGAAMPSKNDFPRGPDTAIYISAPQVCQRYGGVSPMWLVRTLQRDPRFPRPHKFGRLRFFKVADLIRWERETAAKSAA